MTGAVIDHLVYGVPELAPAVARLQALLGVAPAAGGRHEGRRTHNALLALGDDVYLEVIAPDLEQPEPAAPRPFGLNDLTAPRLITFAVHAAPRRPPAGEGRQQRGAADQAAGGTGQPGSGAPPPQPPQPEQAGPAARLERWRRQAVERGYDPGPVTAGGRRRPDGTLLSWHLCQHPELPFGGVVPFLIDWGTAPSPAAAAPPGCLLLALEAIHPDAPAVRAALRALQVAVPVRQGPAPALRASVAAPSGGRVVLT